MVIADDHHGLRKQQLKVGLTKRFSMRAGLLHTGQTHLGFRSFILVRKCFKVFKEQKVNTKLCNKFNVGHFYLRYS